MNQAILITSVPESGLWLANCLKSFHGYDRYQIVILCDYGFELGKIRWVMHHTDLDEFFLLHDTCEVKDPKMFELAFEKYKGKSVALSDSPAMYGMYLGKYRRKILETMRIPTPKNKLENVQYEIDFNTNYSSKDPEKVLLFNDFRDTYVFERKFGRINMKLENNYLIKWKGTWNPEMIKSD